jgi:haloacetate dehalogenase
MARRSSRQSARRQWQRDSRTRGVGDPAAIWRPWAGDLRVASIESGHHMAEENPEALSAALADFLAG